MKDDMTGKRFEDNGRPIPPPPQKYVDQTRRPPTPPTAPPQHPAGSAATPPPPAPGGQPPPPTRQAPKTAPMTVSDGAQGTLLALMAAAPAILFLVAGATTGLWGMVIFSSIVVFVGVWVVSWIGLNPVAMILSETTCATIAVCLWLLLVIVTGPSAGPDGTINLQ